MLLEPRDTEFNRKLQRALTHLKKSNETRVIVLWLESEQERLDISNRHEINDDSVKRTQGGSQSVEKLLEMIEKSEQRLELLDKKLSRQTG